MYNSHSKGKSQVPTFVIVELAQTDEKHGHPHGVSRMLLHQVFVRIHSLEHLIPSHFAKRRCPLCVHDFSDSLHRLHVMLVALSLPKSHA